MWRQYNATKLASASGFHENLQAVLDFNNYRRKQLMKVGPNHAHKILADWMDVIGDIVDKEKKPILLYAIN